MICIVVLTPIYCTTPAGPGFASRLFLIRSLASLFASSFTMYALFGPKIMTLWKDAMKEDHSSVRNTPSPGPFQIVKPMANNNKSLSVNRLIFNVIGKNTVKQSASLEKKSTNNPAGQQGPSLVVKFKKLSKQPK